MLNVASGSVKIQLTLTQQSEKKLRPVWNSLRKQPLAVSWRPQEEVSQGLGV